MTDIDPRSFEERVAALRAQMHVAPDGPRAWLGARLAQESIAQIFDALFRLIFALLARPESGATAESLETTDRIEPVDGETDEPAQHATRSSAEDQPAQFRAARAGVRGAIAATDPADDAPASADANDDATAAHHLPERNRSSAASRARIPGGLAARARADSPTAPRCILTAIPVPFGHHPLLE